MAIVEADHHEAIRLARRTPLLRQRPYEMDEFGDVADQGCRSRARRASRVQVSGGCPGAGLGARAASNSLMSSGRSRSAGRLTERAASVSRSRWRQGPGGAPGV